MSRDVLISGAGIGGLAAGIGLAQLGCTVRIFEKAEQPKDIGAGIQLSPNAMYCLDELGVTDAVEKTAFEPKAGVFRHYRTGEPEFYVPFLGRMEELYGYPYYHIHRADLHRALMNRARHLGVTVSFAEQAKDYEQEADLPRLVTASGTHEADLVIGADGIKSPIKAKMHPGQKPRFTGQIAWRGVIKTSSLPDRLLSPDANCWMGPDRHFVAYYVRGGRLINFVAVAEEDVWTAEDWTQEGSIVNLRQRFDGWDDVVTQLLDQDIDVLKWGLFEHRPLRKWVDGRVALLGDACHAMLPFMAQGAAMALEDAIILARSIDSIETVPDALKDYARRRKPRTRAIRRMSNENARRYHASNPAARLARRTAFAMAQLVPPLVNRKLAKVYAFRP